MYVVSVFFVVIFFFSPCFYNFPKVGSQENLLASHWQRSCCGPSEFVFLCWKWQGDLSCKDSGCLYLFKNSDAFEKGFFVLNQKSSVIDLDGQLKCRCVCSVILEWCSQAGLYPSSPNQGLAYPCFCKHGIVNFLLWEDIPSRWKRFLLICF